MIVVRIFGWLLLLASSMVLGRDIIAAREAARFAPVSLYELWFEIGRTSLYHVKLSLAPYVWQLLTTGLRLWATPALLLLAFALLWLGRKRDRHVPIRSPF